MGGGREKARKDRSTVRGLNSLKREGEEEAERKSHRCWKGEWSEDGRQKIGGRTVSSIESGESFGCRLGLRDKHLTVSFPTEQPWKEEKGRKQSCSAGQRR